MRAAGIIQELGLFLRREMRQLEDQRQMPLRDRCAVVRIRDLRDETLVASNALGDLEPDTRGPPVHHLLQNGLIAANQIFPIQLFSCLSHASPATAVLISDFTAGPRCAGTETDEIPACSKASTAPGRNAASPHTP